MFPLTTFFLLLVSLSIIKITFARDLSDYDLDIFVRSIGLSIEERLNYKYFKVYNPSSLGSLDLFPNVGAIELFYNATDQDIQLIAKSCSHLTWLIVSGENVTDISVLSSLPLETLKLKSTMVSDITPLAKIQTLSSLDVSDSPIADLTALRNLQGLTGLKVAGTKIKDISVAASLPKLRLLDLQRTAIKDTAFLREANQYVSIYHDDEEQSRIQLHLHYPSDTAFHKLETPSDHNTSIQFRISGYCSPKKVRDDHSKLSGPFDCGDDAYFARSVNLPASGKSYLAFGVADGVGGWRQDGYDSSKFAWRLAEYTDRYYRNAVVNDDDNDAMSAGRAMAYAHEKVKEMGDETIGSSTATFLTLDISSGTLNSHHLGDSGFLLLRKNFNGQYDIIFRSQDQYHDFNFPYQLSNMPKGRNLSFDGDSAANGTQNSQTLQKDDIVIVASDGLFDNLFDNEILQNVNDIVSKDGFIDQDRIAWNLTIMAKRQARNGSRISPFGAKEIEANGVKAQDAMGGKLDDTIVLVLVYDMDMNESLVGPENTGALLKSSSTILSCLSYIFLVCSSLIM